MKSTRILGLWQNHTTVPINVLSFGAIATLPILPFYILQKSHARFYKHRVLLLATCAK